MTSPDHPALPRPATVLGPAHPATAEARAAVLAAREGVADAAAAARRSLGVAWESEAASRFRDDVAVLLAELDGDRARLEDLAGVLAR